MGEADFILIYAFYNTCVYNLGKALNFTGKLFCGQTPFSCHSLYISPVLTVRRFKRVAFFWFPQEQSHNMEVIDEQKSPDDQSVESPAAEREGAS